MLEAGTQPASNNGHAIRYIASALNGKARPVCPTLVKPKSKGQFISCLPGSYGSTSPGLQCADLACELVEIDVVTSDDVPIRISDQEVVACPTSAPMRQHG